MSKKAAAQIDRGETARFIATTILPISLNLIDLLLNPALTEPQAPDVLVYTDRMRRFLDALDRKAGRR